MDLCSGGDVLWIVLEAFEVETIFSSTKEFATFC